jgi:hypothetical protein
MFVSWWEIQHAFTHGYVVDIACFAFKILFSSLCCGIFWDLAPRVQMTDMRRIGTVLVACALILGLYGSPGHCFSHSTFSPTLRRRHNSLVCSERKIQLIPRQQQQYEGYESEEDMYRCASIAKFLFGHEKSAVHPRFPDSVLMVAVI